MFMHLVKDGMYQIYLGDFHFCVHTHHNFFGQQLRGDKLPEETGKKCPCIFLKFINFFVDFYPFLAALEKISALCAISSFSLYILISFGGKQGRKRRLCPINQMILFIEGSPMSQKMQGVRKGSKLLESWLFEKSEFQRVICVEKWTRLGFCLNGS